MGLQIETIAHRSAIAVTLTSATDVGALDAQRAANEERLSCPTSAKSPTPVHYEIVDAFGPAVAALKLAAPSAAGTPDRPLCQRVVYPSVDAAIAAARTTSNPARARPGGRVRRPRGSVRPDDRPLSATPAQSRTVRRSQRPTIPRTMSWQGSNRSTVDSPSHRDRWDGARATARICSRVPSSILLGCRPPVGGRSESIPSRVELGDHPPDLILVVCSTTAICAAATCESDAKNDLRPLAQSEQAWDYQRTVRCRLTSGGCLRFQHP